MPKNEIDEFLSGLNDDQKVEPLSGDVSDPFVSTPTEGEPATEKDEDDKPIPFHRDPKIQRFIAKEIAKAVGTKPTETEKFVKETNTEDTLTDVLTKIIGNDTPEKQDAVKQFRKELAGLEEKGAQKAIAQLAAQKEAEQKEERDAIAELQEGLEGIEEKFNVDITSPTSAATKMRTEFIDFITKIAPKDQDGNVTQFPDLESTFEFFKDQRKPDSNSRAKGLASRSMDRSKDASAAPTGGKSWKDIDRMFSKLDK